MPGQGEGEAENPLHTTELFRAPLQGLGVGGVVAVSLTNPA